MHAYHFKLSFNIFPICELLLNWKIFISIFPCNCKETYLHESAFFHSQDNFIWTECEYVRFEEALQLSPGFKERTQTSE